MSKLVDIHGNPLVKDVLREPQTSRLGWARSEFAGHPSRGLTPQRLAAILQAAEQGDLTAQSDLFLDMEEKDAHIYAEMQKRKNAPLTLDWAVNPPKKASAQEKKQAEAIKEWLGGITDFEDVLLGALDGIGHGFSAQEVEWDREGSEWRPATLTHRPQRWFQTVPENGDDLRLRDGSMHGAELWQFGWMVHRHKAKSGYLTRAGLFRVLAWPYLFKNYAIRDWAEFLEIYGVPFRLGTYMAGATEDEKDTLLRAVSDIGHSGAGIMPEGMKMELVAVTQGSQDPFIAMNDWAERSVSKAVLGGTLTSQADGKTSTNALGNVHNEVRRDLLVADTRQLASTIKRDLIYPLIALNFGNADPRRLPDFAFDTREPEDMAAYAESLPKLIGVGFKISRRWAQDKVAIPEPEDEDDVLTVPAEPAPPAAATTTRYHGFQAALTNAQGVVSYPDQVALDAGIDGVPAADLAPLLAPVIAALRAGESPDAAVEGLLAAHPQMSAASVEELLARCIFVADIQGRLNADS